MNAFTARVSRTTFYSAQRPDSLNQTGVRWCRGRLHMVGIELRVPDYPVTVSRAYLRARECLNAVPSAIFPGYLCRVLDSDVAVATTPTDAPSERSPLELAMPSFFAPALSSTLSNRWAQTISQGARSISCDPRTVLWHLPSRSVTICRSANALRSSLYSPSGLVGINRATGPSRASHLESSRFVSIPRHLHAGPNENKERTRVNRSVNADS